jgi:hypothetical protein
VSPFLQHAEEIFRTARQGGEEDCELAILVGRDGQIHMLTEPGWELEPLRLDRGAQAAYRVVRKGGRVRLEARSAGQSCVLEAERPAACNFPLAGR